MRRGSIQLAVGVVCVGVCSHAAIGGARGDGEPQSAEPTPREACATAWLALDLSVSQEQVPINSSDAVPGWWCVPQLPSWPEVESLLRQITIDPDEEALLWPTLIHAVEETRRLHAGPLAALRAEAAEVFPAFNAMDRPSVMVMSDRLWPRGQSLDAELGRVSKAVFEAIRQCCDSDRERRAVDIAEFARIVTDHETAYKFPIALKGNFDAFLRSALPPLEDEVVEDVEAILAAFRLEAVTALEEHERVGMKAILDTQRAMSSRQARAQGFYEMARGVRIHAARSERRLLEAVLAAERSICGRLGPERAEELDNGFRELMFPPVYPDATDTRLVSKLVASVLQEDQVAAFEIVVADTESRRRALCQEMEDAYLEACWDRTLYLGANDLWIAYCDKLAALANKRLALALQMTEILRSYGAGSRSPKDAEAFIDWFAADLHKFGWKLKPFPTRPVMLRLHPPGEAKTPSEL